MKKNILSLMAIFTISVTSLLAQEERKAEFLVAGNCGMCETRIERAALSVSGVSSANWDKESKLVTVFYDSRETEIDKVHLSIAMVGHDTKKYRASDEVYEKLPACCKYERMESESSGQQKL